MADPTGTIGAAKESNLDLAVRGGPRFTARLQQFADATDRHERAFAKLRLGQDAAAALKDAAEQRSLGFCQPHGRRGGAGQGQA